MDPDSAAAVREADRLLSSAGRESLEDEQGSHREDIAGARLKGRDGGRSLDRRS